MRSLQGHLTKLTVTNVTPLEAKMWKTAGKVPSSASSGRGVTGGATAQNKLTAEECSMHEPQLPGKLGLGHPAQRAVWNV